MTTASQVNTAALNIEANHEASYISRGPVTVSLQFYNLPVDGSKPWNYVEQPLEGR